MSQSRQFVAITFTGIVGYTGLIKSAEKKHPPYSKKQATHKLVEQNKKIRFAGS